MIIKTLVISLCAFFISSITLGQSVSIKPSIGITDNSLYITPASIGVAFNYQLKKTELMAEFRYSKFNTNVVMGHDFHPLNEQFITTSEVWARTKAFSLEISPLFYLKKNEFASVSLGPSAGISSFGGELKIYYDSINGLAKVKQEYTYEMELKPFAGLIFKTEINEVITKKMSLFFTVATKLYIHKRTMDCGGVHLGPTMLFCTDFGMGLLYLLK